MLQWETASLGGPLRGELLWHGWSCALKRDGIFPRPVFSDTALTLVKEANACDARGSGVEAGGSVFECDATERIDRDG